LKYNHIVLRDDKRVSTEQKKELMNLKERIITEHKINSKLNTNVININKLAINQDKINELNRK